MKTFSLEGCKLVDPQNPLNGKLIDIQVKNGLIHSISEAKSGSASDNPTHISPAFIDILADFCDPGMEHREDFRTGSKAALSGGYASVALNPYTQPVIDSKSKVAYLQGLNLESPINILPLATLSVNGENVDIPEIYDMTLSGACGFYSGKAQVNEKLLITALQYCDGLKALPMVFPQTDSLAHNGQINESIVSSKTGLKPIPAIAEELALANIIKLLEYAGGKVHITHISSAKSVALIAEAKSKGLAISCSVAGHQLLFTDEEALSFDSRSKVNPPYRNQEDRKALIEACKTGIIDAIISDHSPVDIEAKKIEYDHADFGIISLQTNFPALRDGLKSDLNEGQIIELLNQGPAKILGRKSHEIKVNEVANFTLWKDEEWTLTKANIHSRSKNSPFIGKSFSTKIIGTAAKGSLSYFN